MQEGRQIEVTSPLGKDVLLFRRMTGKEELGRSFEFNVELLSDREDIKPSEVLGKKMTVRLDLDDGDTRFFNGHVCRFGHVGESRRHAVYRATLRPWLWFLTRTADCRIFQDMKVPDIIKQVFRDHGFADFDEALEVDYRPLGYCVQYRETTYNFVSRLMEQEGIHHYFKQEEDKHTLVLSDSVGSHESRPGYEQVPFYPHDERAPRDRDFISSWVVFNEIRPGSYSLEEYDYERPRADLTVRSSKVREHESADFEVYDYPGDYMERGEGDQYVRARIEEMQAQYERVNGAGVARGLAAGNLFELTGHPRADQNREYLVVNVAHELEQNPFETTATDSGPIYRCRFAAIGSKQPYRSPRVTPKPIVQGPQTAVVVGPAGETKWTDEYARVKVQFHWDREGKNDENSSCWIRVSQNWGGKKWGGLFIPHIGQEVIVEFLEGDPDRPIITGRVYNAVNMPPLDLPGEAVKSIIRDDYGNEIIFDADVGTITIRSPTHESSIVLGKSIHLKSLSDLGHWTAANWKQVIQGDKNEEIIGKTNIKVGADVKELFIGAQHKTILGSVSKLVSPFKSEAILGASTKVIGGRKNEIIKGSVVKGHWGTTFQLRKGDDAEKAPAVIRTLGKAYYGVKDKLYHKAGTWNLKAHFKAQAKAKDIELDAGGDMDFKCWNHKHTANEVVAKAEKYKAKFKKYRMEGSKAVVNAKMSVKNGTLQIK